MIKNNEKLVISKTSKELILIDLSLIFALCLCLFGVIKSFPIVYSIIINNFQINNSEYGQTFIFNRYKSLCLFHSPLFLVKLS